MASSFGATFLASNGGTAAAAEAVLAQGLAEGKAYFNIHTTLFPGGEIRANLTAVPEPAALVLLGFSFTLIAVRRRRQAVALPDRE